MGTNITHGDMVIHRYCGPAWIGKDRRCYSFNPQTKEYLTHEELIEFHKQLTEYLTKEGKSNG